VAADSSGNICIADSGNQRIRKVVTSGIITTIAGNGTSGYSGDGGAATEASFNTPWGVTVDNSGNIYIADTYNSRIRKVNTSGIITTIAGNGQQGIPVMGSGNRGKPLGAYLHGVDSSRNIYIAEYNNHSIRKVYDANQTTTTTINGTTTTTTPKPSPCVAEAIYGESAEQTELLRKYRDNVLTKTPEGQEL